MVIKIIDLCNTSCLWDVINEIDDNISIKDHYTNSYEYGSDIRIENKDCILLTQNETITLIYDMTSRTAPREDFDEIKII